MNCLPLLNHLPITESAYTAGAWTTYQVCTSIVPESYAITRILISVLCVNVAAEALMDFRLVKTIPLDTWVMANLVSTIFLSFLALRYPQKPVSEAEKIIKPTFKLSVPESLREESNIEFFDKDFFSEPPIEQPPFLKSLKVIPFIQRIGQLEQIKRALGGQSTSHAAVLSCDEKELEKVLSVEEERAVFQFDMQQLDGNYMPALISFLSSHKNAIIYLPDLNLLLQMKNFSYLLTVFEEVKASVVGCVKHALTTDAIFQMNIKKFKTVTLIPLTKEQCLEEIKQWAKDYQSEDKALNIAVEAAFLLKGGHGNESVVVQDLLERARKMCKENGKITIDNVLDVVMEFEMKEGTKGRVVDALKKKFQQTQS